MRAIAVATAAALLIFAGACIGDSTGTATVSGTLNGHSFNPIYAISNEYTFDHGDSEPWNLALVAVTDNPGLCEALTAGNQPKDAQYLLFRLGVSESASAAPTAPTSTDVNQDFTVWLGSGFFAGRRPTRMALVVASTTEVLCYPSYGLHGSHGTVRLTGLSGQAYSATFAVDLATRDEEGNLYSTVGHVSGSFHSRRCPALHPFLVSMSNCTSSSTREAGASSAAKPTSR